MKEKEEVREIPWYKRKLASTKARVIDKDVMKAGDVFIDSKGRKYMKCATGVIERVKE